VLWWCREVVVFAGVVDVRFSWAWTPVPHPLFWLEYTDFGPATRRLAGWGRCLTTHPQLRVWVVKHLKDGGWWVAGKASGGGDGGGVGVGVGPGKGGDGCSMACVVVCLFLFPALHSGRIGCSGNGGASRDPLPERRRRFAVRPCVAGALGAPAAVKNCKKTFGYDGDSLVSGAHLCRRLIAA
jgi:hypothetical protein